MNFLEAHRIVAAFKGGEPLRFVLAMSGAPTQLDIYIRAYAAQQDREAKYSTPSFGTLQQSLLDRPQAENEVFLLMPWDFIPEADWRSGVPEVSQELSNLRARALAFAELLRRRAPLKLLYVDAPLLPMLLNEAEMNGCSHWLKGLACELGAEVLHGSSFSLSSYLSNGCPIGSGALDATAAAIVRKVTLRTPEPAKVLVTDLDNVMWAGVIAEDGLEGIQCSPDGVGYRHFLYQGLLAKLRREGVLLAAVSRNDPDLAIAPFRSGKTSLQESDFVSCIASYEAKSAQIRGLAAALNLSLESFVFVDDNPVELAEVAAQLPDVRCLRFEENEEQFPVLLNQLIRLFGKPWLTEEDHHRTELYRARAQVVVPSTLVGADLTSFLRELEMKLIIHDRSSGDRTRAVQLINKTNQFNLNGRRVTDEEIGRILAGGGRLYTASLSDRNGSHGEILALLMDSEGSVHSFVLSCRVFQRRVETAFLVWLASQQLVPTQFLFQPSPRNTPIQQFLRDPAFVHEKDGPVIIRAADFARGHTADLQLFEVHAPDAAMHTDAAR